MRTRVAIHIQMKPKTLSTQNLTSSITCSGLLGYPTIDGRLAQDHAFMAIAKTTPTPPR